MRLQIKWTNVSGYFLSDDCSVWARNLAASNVSIYAAAGATLINSVTLSLAGPATVNLRTANATTEATGGVHGCSCLHSLLSLFVLLGCALP